jgi:lipopolysaccharide heptosyltransferase II
MMQIAREWQTAQHILCVRLDRIGDVLMTTPAIHALQATFPQARITLMTSSAGAETAAYLPDIDGVIVYDAPWMKASPARASSQYDHQMIASLRGIYDAAVIFTVYSQSPLPAALFCYLCDIPTRLAYCRENPYHLLTHWIQETEPSPTIRHEVQRHLDLVAAVGCETEDQRLKFQVTEANRNDIRDRLQTLGVDRSRPWMVLHPGVSAPSRQYAPEGYAQVASQLAVEHGFQIVFTGGVSENALVESIRFQMNAPSFSLAGEINLGQLGALLEEAPLLLSNNTGPVHMAAAVRTPVVDVYALTNPQHTPWGVPNRVVFHDVPCKYCYKSICPEGHHHCLSLVTPQEIVQAVCELFSETASFAQGFP